MVLIGMIFQYDSMQKRGLIMLSNGEKIEFGASQWTDPHNTAALGQKVSCKKDNGCLEIMLADKDAVITPASEIQEQEELYKNAQKPQEPASMPQFSSFEACIVYYEKMGFNLVKDTFEEQTRVATLRMYSVNDYGEIIIKLNGSTIDVEQMLNGKKL